MRRTYSKAPLTFEQQLDLLKHRDMLVEDDAETLRILSTVSYYRLSAYWFPFRQRAASGDSLDTFVPGTSFNQVAEKYNFDRALRAVVLEAIADVEVAMRTRVTYQIALAHGPFGHTDATNFHPNFNHQRWIDKLYGEVERSQDKFIQHYKSSYQGFPILPIWMTTEVMSLGALSILCSGLNNLDRRAVADYFDLPGKALKDWMHTITYVRNVSAHHSRLWNRQLAIRTGSMKAQNWQPPVTPRKDRLFYVLLMLSHLMKATGGREAWVQKVNELLMPVADNYIEREAMGLPEEWLAHPLWR